LEVGVDDQLELRHLSVMLLRRCPLRNKMVTDRRRRLPQDIVLLETVICSCLAVLLPFWLSWLFFLSFWCQGSVLVVLELPLLLQWQ
jgi:type IV secretory pathway TrbD component